MTPRTSVRPPSDPELATLSERVSEAVSEAEAEEPSSTTDEPRRDYISAAEAVKLLNIRIQTLYAYVSRGVVRSIPQHGHKERLYLRDDVERVGGRALARSGIGALAATAMNWGEPIIPTSITEITPEGPRYRGRLAQDLARVQAPFESVAELLWTGLWHADTPRWQVTPPAADFQRMADSFASVQAGDRLLEIFALATLQLGIGRGPVTQRLHGGRTVDAARQIMQALVGCCGLLGPTRRYMSMQDGLGIAEGLLVAFGAARSQENRLAVEAILTMLADHELSPGALAARVTASTGGTLHSCVAAAICASSGVETARLYDRVDAFLGDASRQSVLVARATELQQRGAVVPGFVHPLYPHGDPRARYLLDVTRRRQALSAPLSAILGFLGETEAALKLHPRQEFALVTLSRAMGLPPHAPSALFVLARVAGWVAHVQEQRLTGYVLRPRAKFVGPGARPTP